MTLLMNDKGDILEISSRSSGYAYSLERQFKLSGNIRSFFGLQQEDRLSRVIRKTDTLSAAPGLLEFSEAREFFYFAMPAATLKLIPLEAGRFLGAITISSLMPAVFEEQPGGLFFLNEKQEIIGFNRSFFEQTRFNGRDPAVLLNRPIERVLSPSPAGLQEQALAEMRQEESGEWAALLERDFAKEGPGPEIEMDAPHRFTPAANGLAWEAGTGSGSFLTLLKTADLRAQDLCVRVSFIPSDGRYPGIMLGDRGKPGTFRDENGYLLAPLEKDYGRLVLKRQGFAVIRSGPGVKAQSELSFLWTNGAFSASADGKEALSYFDYHRIPRGPTHVILYLRTGDRCLLRGLSVRIRPSSGRRPAPLPLVKMRGAASRTFFLNRFYSYFTSGYPETLSGWRLQDVTELQDKVRALEARHRKEASESERLKRMLGRFGVDPDGVVGSGKAMARILETAGRAAESTATVLIQGPTGSGKEVLARHIHSRSGLREGPFVKVDCSAIPQTLLESELFGYERGAFTGADQARAGLFESANHGTLFLDEVGNLPHATQVRLLQFLQDFTLTRLGSTLPVRLNLRIIAATNADLPDLVKRGLFREDLYYRLAVVVIETPPLKERGDDLPELCRHFLNLFNSLYNKKIRGFSPSAFTRLQGHGWPGNIRELKNVMERAVLFCDKSEIQESHITLPEAPAGAAKRKKKTAVNATREELSDLLRKHGGVVRRAAEELRVSAASLYYTFKKMGLDPNLERKNPHRR